MPPAPRAWLLGSAICATLGCGGPAPVPVPPPGAHATPAAPPTTLSFAPDEAGITDIARVSRYVYREMNARAECALEDLPPGRYDYAYDVTVALGRITEARLASVAHVEDAGPHDVPLDQWPSALQRRLACLLPHLKRVEMAPAPADGVYPTRFAAGGPAR